MQESMEIFLYTKPPPPPLSSASPKKEGEKKTSSYNNWKADLAVQYIWKDVFGRRFARFNFYTIVCSSKSHENVNFLHAKNSNGEEIGCWWSMLYPIWSQH